MKMVTRGKSHLTWITLTVLFWANLVIAQEGDDMQDTGNDFGPMLAILLGGLLVIALLGAVMYIRDTTNSNVNEQ